MSPSPHLPCRHVVAHLGVKYPGIALFAAGWSLGANILVRYLGEEGGATPIAAAAAMCNPFDLVRQAGVAGEDRETWGWAAGCCWLLAPTGRGGDGGSGPPTACNALRIPLAISTPLSY